MDTQPNIIYKEHPGTIKVSGSTIPKKAGRCAFFYMDRSVTPIEFLCIGANANQQAMKSMGVLRYLIQQKSLGKVDVAFQPIRVHVITIDPEFNTPKEKDATIWRMIILDTSKLPSV